MMGTTVARAATDFGELSARLAATGDVSVRGRLRSAVGLAIEAELPGARIGQLVRIERGTGAPLLAEVAGFREQGAILLPLGDAAGLSASDAVVSETTTLGIEVGDHLLGRVLDGLGSPIDGAGALRPSARATRMPLRGASVPAMQRPPITRPLSLGVRAIDALCTVGEGQRIGLFAGAGVGKSTLLSQIARHTDADVVVACLVGERGRELRQFIDDGLLAGGRPAVVVCAQSDEPPLLRVKSAQLATAIAEGYRAQGKRVLLLMDSLTRYARALREVALSLGELPARRGYPASVFAALPQLLERAGTSADGSITAVYSVLVEGDALDEPIGDELRGLLDGHVVLGRALAERNHYPAIDVLASLSRLMPTVAQPQHIAAAGKLRELLATYEDNRDLVTLGAYSRGGNAALDTAIVHIDAIERFLRQPRDERPSFESTLDTLTRITNQL